MLGPDFLPAERVRCDTHASSRKDALQSLSKLLADGPGQLQAPEIYGLLNERDRLGSTCLGNGVALPHTRDDRLEQAVGARLRLSEPVDFDAVDGTEVSILLGIVLPESAESGDLSLLASTLRQPDSIAMLQRARSPADAAEIIQARLLAAGEPTTAG